MDQKNQVTMTISDGDAFYANESTINYNPTQFIFDFKCITPRIDQRNPNGNTVVLKHNVVVIEPWHIKLLHGVLAESLKRYEQDFGAIEKPKAIELWEQKNQQVPTQTSVRAPDYMG